jgi:opacity protein-like surface antigen
MARVLRAAMILSVAALLLSGSVAAAAQPVVVQVTSIAAWTAPDKSAAPSETPVVDPELAGFEKNLQSLFAYNRYTFMDSSKSDASLGGACSFQLPDRFTLEVEPERYDAAEGGGRIEMLVTLFHEVQNETPASERERATSREIVLRTRIRLENGGTVLLGGPPIREGVLILALSARR